ncbi:hypothetical protein B0H14DRAFT_3726915 [Mycena olivaceomarginata]|nr:hypothetical protein B0H14DRAFT_3726915 [Mycena olivaceomarginata]
MSSHPAMQYPPPPYPPPAHVLAKVQQATAVVAPPPAPQESRPGLLDAVPHGHFNAGAVRNRRPPRPRVYEENDGRAPDTVAALAAAAAVEALGATVPSDVSAAAQAVSRTLSVPYSPRMLQSFRWDSPNSCFFDNPLEIWFRAFARWSEPERLDFLASIPSSSALAKFFYIFQRRLVWISGGSQVDLHGIRDLSLCQSHARMLIFDRWKLYDDPHAYGNATLWLPPRYTGDTSFNYDDLARRGSLVPAGPAELICIPDRHAVMWTYNRTSTADTTTREINEVVPEPFFGAQTTPRKWCKIKTVIRKAAAARILASFLLAGVYDLHGNNYEWEANKPEGQKPTESTRSSPLSEAPHSDPMDVDSAQDPNVVGPQTIVAVIEPKGLKRNEWMIPKRRRMGKRIVWRLGLVSGWHAAKRKDAHCAQWRLKRSGGLYNSQTLILYTIQLVMAALIQPE